jgi:AAHS family 4-hydroxybenzoate transporter-like MFS transporter
MAQAQTIDVSALIDERRVTAFNWGLVIFSFFVILFDGYDIGAVSFAGPHLIQAWHISRAAMGPAISAGLFGILFGSPILGYVGDRWGRKIAIVVSSAIYGVFTLAIVWATGIDQLIYLRFCAGIGIGGLLPNIIALNAEFAPKRVRATLVIIMFCGITFGGSVPGMVSVFLVPAYGWQILFWIGGVLPLIMAVLVAAFMPESLKFLVVNHKPRERIVKILRAMAPEVSVPAGASFAVRDEKQYRGFNPKYLFADGLAPITITLWICFICNLMAFYFIQGWLPIILTSIKIPISQAAWAGTLFQIGGTLGGLVLARPIDTKGLTPVLVLFVLSIPITALIGFIGLRSEGLLFLMVTLSGFCTLGLQFGLNAASALIYPTALRSNGSGWAFAIGRVGSATGPLIGGVLIAAHMPLTWIYVCAAVPFVIGTVSAIGLTRFYYRRFEGGLGTAHDTYASATGTGV